jgi:hypothetical protein
MGEKDTIKIMSVVKFNDGEAWVLNRRPEIIYTKDGGLRGKGRRG